MANKPIPQIVRVSDTALRKLFNDNYLPLIGTKKIVERVMRKVLAVILPCLSRENLTALKAKKCTILTQRPAKN